MSLSTSERATTAGAFWALLAMLCFSTVDVLIKFLSDGYPLYQLVFIRTMFGLAVVLFIMVPLTGAYSMLKTKRLGLQIARGLCVVFANFAFFLGLAAMPLAEAVAIFFISPLVITVFSVVFLGEQVGPRRWAAIAVGLIGVLIVLRPGTAAFQVAALLPLVAAFGYAMLHIITRKIGDTEHATTLVFYAHLTFLAASAVAGLALGNGRFDTFDHPSMVFLFRSWVWPGGFDLFLLAVLGIATSLGGFAISEAYRRSEAALVAPFEYVTMPLAIAWGLVVLVNGRTGGPGSGLF